MTDPANAASREARAIQAEFLRDLAARIFRHGVPSAHFDQGDSDQLYAFVNFLADEAASQPREAGPIEQAVARIAANIDRDGGGGLTAPVNGEQWLVISWEQYDREMTGKFERGKAAALRDTAPTDQAQGGGEVEPDLQLFEQIASGQVDPRYSRSSLAGAVKRIRAALAQNNPTDGGVA